MFNVGAGAEPISQEDNAPASNFSTATSIAYYPFRQFPMPQSKRRRPRARFRAHTCTLAALLAACAAATALGQEHSWQEYGGVSAWDSPVRLPAIGREAAGYPRSSSVDECPASPPSFPRASFAPVRLVDHQEELPPGAATADRPPAFEEDVIPLDFSACGGCDACGGGCPEFCDHWQCGRFFWGFYHAICCPDPCYDPCWWALSDAAFFVEAARPVTQTRLRWDAGIDLVFPDRAEYFWARSGAGGRGPAAVERKLRYHELSHYTEVAHGGFSAFFQTPYRSYDAAVNSHEAGFGDLIAGTKSMLLDCQLLQITYQMKFITPTGISTKGLGTGHLSIEPSLIFGLNMSSQSYIQAQVAEWIPIAGDETYAGALLHYHFSYNRTLLGCPGYIHLIGTAELNGWSFQDGAYSDPALAPPQRASNQAYLSSGFGLRMVLCDKVDFGVGTAFAVTDGHWAKQLYRSELRVRF